MPVEGGMPLLDIYALTLVSMPAAAVPVVAPQRAWEDAMTSCECIKTFKVYWDFLFKKFYILYKYSMLNENAAVLYSENDWE